MKKWVCPVCGYVHEGENPPAECPVCHVSGEKFTLQAEEKTWAAEHVVGVAQGVDEEILKGLRENFQGECTEVGMYLAMSRQAKLYLLDEPIGGVDPAARDYILDTIIRNYNPEASVIISTHLIADVEKVLDEVLFIDRGQILLQSSVDAIREEKGMSVDALFREVYKC